MLRVYAKSAFLTEKVLKTCTYPIYVVFLWTFMQAWSVSGAAFVKAYN